MQEILVTGAAGYIGSHMSHVLLERGFVPVMLDDLSAGSERALPRGPFYKGCISDRLLLRTICQKHRIKAVLHFAAHIAVGESEQNPLKYYENNVAKSCMFFQELCAQFQKVDQLPPPLVFSSTATVYGVPKYTPIDEEHPKDPISPYGRTKLMIEQILADCEKAHGLRSYVLRYFNAAGGDPHHLRKNYNSVRQNLIPIVLQVLHGGKKSIPVFGNDYPTRDGTCIRDYIHIDDLAQAHLSALERLLAGAQSAIYNLGTGLGSTVIDVLQCVETVTSHSLTYEYTPRRPGDAPILVADAKKAQEALGWTPRYTLEKMIEDAWCAFPS